MNDIKWINTSYSLFNNFMFWQFLIILLLVFIYIYNTRVVKKKQEKKAIKKSEKKIIKKTKKAIENKLKKLLKNSSSLDKTHFYEQLNKYFREYFDFLWFHNTDILTLKEIKTLDLDKKILSLFEKSYLNEFNDKKDTLATRKKLINDLLKII